MTNKAKQKILRLDTQSKFPYLVEVTYVYNDGTEEMYHYANCDDVIEFEGVEYEPSSFFITPPEKNQTSISNASISISIADQFWIKKIRGTRQRSRIRFIATIEYDENGTRYIEAIEDYDFTLTLADWDESYVKWTMVFDEGMSINMPCDIATSQKVPALA